MFASTLKPKSNFFPQTTSTQSKPVPFFQPKFTVNTPGDAHEQEADRVADQVMRMKEGDAPIVQRMPLTPVSGVQRKCAECEKEEKEQVQRKEASGQAGSQTAPSIVSNVLSSGGGQPMDGGTRQYMENRFGQDFGQVRIHTGGQAAESAAAIQARAYTSGRDIVFGKGEYQPGSEGGKRLLAHELVHVGQQNKKDGVAPQIQRNAWAVGGAAALAFLAGFGAAFAADYLTMTRNRSLRFARSMGTGWLSLLPNCPCTKPDSDPVNWERDANPNLGTYHPGATFSYRSTAEATPGIRHGQQCTYDAGGRLIRSGAGAGTPDFYSPSTWYNIPYHVVYDVKTWKELGWSTYNSYWIPNRGVNCDNA